METNNFTSSVPFLNFSIRINDTLQGDGNLRISSSVLKEYLFVHKNE